MTYPVDDLEKILTRAGACPEAIPWARQYGSFEELWKACDAPDWMLWGLDAFGFTGQAELRHFAVACARRVRRLWNDPRAALAIDTAARFADGRAGPAELTAAHAATWAARESLAKLPDYSEAMAAAASAALATVRDSAMDAAMDASRESARAVWWDPSAPGSWREEGTWQSGELRRIVGAGVHPLIASVRKKARGVLTVI